MILIKVWSCHFTGSITIKSIEKNIVYGLLNTHNIVPSRSGPIQRTFIFIDYVFLLIRIYRLVNIQSKVECFKNYKCDHTQR